MYRFGFVFICLVLLGCKDKKKGEEGTKTDGLSYQEFSDQFSSIALPYQLSDTGFLHNRDTAAIHSQLFAPYLTDSLKAKLFGKTAKLHFTAIGKTPDRNGVVLYLVKVTSAGKKAALLYAFSKGEYASMIPFLVPDGDASTSQVSSIDKSQSILVNIVQKKSDGTVAEGKDVYGFYPDLKQFALILTNPLNTGNLAIQNPIDTLRRTHRFAGDYLLDKRNFVSVRDGRSPNQLQVFIHIEKNEGSCTGELKGTILMTSATGGVYQQGGDPCVLSLRFSSTAVILQEQEGCGSRRGLDCSFDGTFNKKKEARQKPAAKKK